MATVLKQRLRRFNGLDYDTIHLETESELVKRPNGGTVEAAITTLDSIKMNAKIADDTLPNTYYKLGFDNGALYVEETT